MTSPDERIEMLERRARRERAARLEAERLAEEGLRRLYEANRLLDRRVEERTRAAEEARTAALEADRAKTEFLANLSHEVGTPLQTILSAVELTEPDDEDDRRRLRMAASATIRLDRLFRNLLELAQCEVGRIDLRPEPTDLEVITERLMAHWAERLAATGHRLTPDVSGSAVVDTDRLVQIGDLLLDNVSRFADGGPVGLRLACTSGGTELAVADSGPGVPEESLGRILEPFAQARGGNDRPVGGAGIGLALVQGLAQHMGGVATATTNERGGLTVRVVLPPRPGPLGDEQGVRT